MWSLVIDCVEELDISWKVIFLKERDKQGH